VSPGSALIDEDNRMKMAFFELEGWERPVLANRFVGHELFLHDDVLSPKF
jgi:hypothetical protein